MPVVVESINHPSAQDGSDLAKIYADAPDWLLPPDATAAALIEAGSRCGNLIAGRFNDRLLDEAQRLAREAGKPLHLVSPKDQLEHQALAARLGLMLDNP
jgi:hypothetical protein